MRKDYARFFACSLLVLSSVAIGGLSYCQLTMPPHRVTQLSLGSAFLLVDVTGVKCSGWFGGWALAVIYILFHASLAFATAMALLLLTINFQETRPPKGRLVLALLLSAPTAWLMSYWALFGMFAWGFLAVVTLTRRPSIYRILRVGTVACIALVGTMYLIMLLLWPTIPPNEMP